MTHVTHGGRRRWPWFWFWEDETRERRRKTNEQERRLFFFSSNKYNFSEMWPTTATTATNTTTNISTDNNHNNKMITGQKPLTCNNQSNWHRQNIGISWIDKNSDDQSIIILGESGLNAIRTKKVIHYSRLLMLRCFKIWLHQIRTNAISTQRWRIKNNNIAIQ